MINKQLAKSQVFISKNKTPIDNTNYMIIETKPMVVLPWGKEYPSFQSNIPIKNWAEKTSNI